MLTRLGLLLSELLAGLEAVDVSQSDMERLGRDLFALEPPRYARATPRVGGKYAMQMIGPAVLSGEGSDVVRVDDLSDLAEVEP